MWRQHRPTARGFEPSKICDTQLQKQEKQRAKMRWHALISWRTLSNKAYIYVSERMLRTSPTRRSTAYTNVTRSGQVYRNSFFRQQLWQCWRCCSTNRLLPLLLLLLVWCLEAICCIVIYHARVFIICPPGDPILGLPGQWSALSGCRLDVTDNDDVLQDRKRRENNCA